MATDVTADTRAGITVLLEVERFRREVHIKNGEDALVCLEGELRRIGKDVRFEISASASVQDSSDSTKEVCRLQRWSKSRKCFVDITDASQIIDGDKLIAICLRRSSRRRRCRDASSVTNFASISGKVNAPIKVLHHLPPCRECGVI